MASTQQLFKISIKGVSAEMNVVRFRGREGVSELFDFEVEFVSDDAAIDFDAVVGKPALLEMTTNDEPRFVHGIVSRFEEIGVGVNQTTYLARMVPTLWTYGLKNDCCIYQGMKIPDVIKDILTSGGMASGSDFRFELNASYPTREYIVQYRETDLQFVSRLMEEVGIFYFFEHKEDGHVLVLGDHTGAHTDIAGTVVLPFHADDTGMQADTDEVSSLRLSRSMRTGKVSMRSFNFEKNKLKLEAASSSDTETAHEHYDFDGRYGDESAGKSLAQVRQETFTARRRLLFGDSNCRHLTTGFKFGVTDHPRDEFNADYLLTRVVHTGVQPQAAGGAGSDVDEPEEAYSNSFEAIPADVVFRPLQLTESALVDGPQTAVVTGPSGEEIYTDAHGRVKVMFHWDRYGTADDKASCWMRVAQSHRIADFAIPRIGEEVIVDFLEGDPDQPIITGRVYNGTNTTPYSLPADKTKSTFKTPTSPGGGGYNELRFEDASGSEEVFFHAQKDWNSVILNDRTTDVGHDQLAKIGNDKTIEVGANHTEKIGGSMQLKVAGSETEKIDGNRSIEVGGNHQEQVKGALGLTVGETGSVSIGGDGSVKIGGKGTINVSGDLQESAGGKMSVSSGGNYSLSAGGSGSISTSKKLTVEVEDAMATSVAKDSTVSIGKKQKITVKDDSGLEAKRIIYEATDMIVFKTGDASIALKKNGDIIIKGGKISIKSTGDVIMKGSKITQN